MKKISIYIFFFSFLVSIISCSKYLDVNKDPNNPTDVNESLILAPVIASISTNVAGGSFSQLNYNGVAMITSYWMQQIALNQDQPQIDGYKCRPDDVDQAWLTMYATILENLKLLDAKAVKSGNNSYGVISKILTAYTLGITTDMWGDVPFSKALNGLNGQYKSVYDKQEDIYKNLQAMLDSAIAQNQKPAGGSLPKGDDFIYGGNMVKWQKFAYALKARYYMHLTKAVGYTPIGQANLALNAISKSFDKESDEANYKSYTASPGSESPWFVNTEDGQGGVVLASNLIDSLIIRNDPRLGVIATKGNGGNYLGRPTGENAAPDVKIYSTLNTFYADAGAKQLIMSFAELQFLKAEANLIVNGSTIANVDYVNAMTAGFNRLGVNIADASVISFMANRNIAYSQNALKAIIEDKVIANLLSPENYNDWRRTGYPILNLVQNAFTPTIPVRFPYPLNERTSNVQPEHIAKFSTPVWWAK